MTPKEGLKTHLHPEGLNLPQEELLKALFTTKTLGKIVRRFENQDGSFRFETSQEDINIFAFAKDPEHEFAITEHIEGDPGAPLSPFFINLRNLTPDILKQIGEVMHDMTPIMERQAHFPKPPDLIAGVPKAGVPLARAYSQASGIPFDEIFDKEETETSKRIVSNGKKGEGQKVRLVDDLASQGITKIQAVKAAEEVQYEVASFYVLIDREQGGLDILKKYVPDVRAAMKITQIFDFALRKGFIDQGMHEKCLSYIKN